MTQAPTILTRRTILKHCGLLGLIALCLPVRSRASLLTGHPTPTDPVMRAFSQLYHRYVADGGAALPPLNREVTSLQIRELTRTDFIEGRIAVVGGWTVSITELRLGASLISDVRASSASFSGVAV